jgi:hypothetical protein
MYMIITTLMLPVVVVSSNVKRISGRISSSDTQGGDESTTTDSRADNTSGNR